MELLHRDRDPLMVWNTIKCLPLLYLTVWDYSVEQFAVQSVGADASSRDSSALSAKQAALCTRVE
jgi:hypothetical protein